LKITRDCGKGMRLSKKDKIKILIALDMAIDSENSLIDAYAHVSSDDDEAIKVRSNCEANKLAFLKLIDRFRKDLETT